MDAETPIGKDLLDPAEEDRKILFGQAVRPPGD